MSEEPVEMEITIYDDGSDPDEKPLWQRLKDAEKEIEDDGTLPLTERPWSWTEKGGYRDE